MPAGCSFATSLVRVFVLDVADLFLLNHPAVSLDICIDDWTVDQVGTEGEVLEELPYAVHNLGLALERDLGCELSIPKAAVVASSDHLAQRLRARVGRLAGGRVGTARRLGVDFAPGRPRAQWGGSTVRRQRIQNAAHRTRRAVAFIFAEGGPRTQKLYSSGGKPKAGFGAEVTGVTDA